MVIGGGVKGDFNLPQVLSESVEDSVIGFLINLIYIEGKRKPDYNYS